MSKNTEQEPLIEYACRREGSEKGARSSPKLHLDSQRSSPVAWAHKRRTPNFETGLIFLPHDVKFEGDGLCEDRKKRSVMIGFAHNH